MIDKQRFWGRLGFEQWEDKGGNIWVRYPDGGSCSEYPDINSLDALFEHAVDDEDMVHFYPWEGKICCNYAPKGNLVKTRTGAGKTHAQALALAIDKVMEKRDV